MRVNKLIRLWVRGGRSGIYDASSPVKRTGVINAAPTMNIEFLQKFEPHPSVSHTWQVST